MKYLRPILYVSIFIVGVIFVEAKKQDVRDDKAREVESVLSIINDNGLPIKIYEVKPRTFTKEYLLHLKPCGQKRACFFSSYAERELFKLGQSVQGHTKASELKGEVVEIATQAQGGSGLYRVVVSLDQSIERDALVEVLVDQKRNALVIPLESVVQIENLTQVFIYSEGIVKSRTIEVAQKSQGEILVKSGLEVGEQIVVEGISQLDQYNRFNVVGEFEFSKGSQL